jgi:hypothetical protein
MRRTELPANMEELVTYDVVVLCDPRHSPGSMDEKLIGLLDAFVSKHQGGLCCILPRGIGRCDGKVRRMGAFQGADKGVEGRV